MTEIVGRLGAVQTLLAKLGDSDAIAAIRKDTAECLARMSAPFELALPKDVSVDKLEKRLASLTAAADHTAEAVEAYQENFVKFVEDHRDHNKRLQETLIKTAESSTSFMDDVKYVAGELLNLSTEYTLLRGGKPEDAAAKMGPHVENMVVAREAIKNKMTALGGGLLRVNLDGVRRVDPLVLPTSIAKVEAVVAGEPKDAVVEGAAK